MGAVRGTRRVTARPQVIGNYETVRGQFPGASVVASTFDAFTKVLATVKSSLPVVTGEIGDTWMMGVPSDPAKMSTYAVLVVVSPHTSVTHCRRYREIVRARKECIDSGACSINDPVMKNFTRFLIKVGTIVAHTWAMPHVANWYTVQIPEHTWGIPGLYDNGNWSNAQFEKARSGINYANAQSTWIEQRYFNDLALEVSTVQRHVHTPDTAARRLWAATLWQLLSAID